MPVYEFKCNNDKCGEKFEVIKPMSESSKDEKCPRCGAASKRIFSIYSFKFSKINFH